MESFPTNSNSNKEEKSYLYHKVPEKMEGSVLMPLGTLENKHPTLYASYMEKYAGREHVPEQFVEYLNTKWKDLLMFSPQYHLIR